MKSLKTLIKLNKKELDKLLNDKRIVEERLDNFVKRLEGLEQEAEEETKKFHNSAYAYMLDPYLQSFRKQRDELTGYIKTCEKQIHELMNRIAEQFSEIKKYEIALKNREIQLQEKEKKKEMEKLDEFTINKFARKKK